MANELKFDPEQRVAIDTNRMNWQSSPYPGLWRKRLEFSSGKAGRVTTLVRFQLGTTFPFNEHPQGEEILVLEGTFSDESGDYPAGYFLLYPHGTRHSPFSQAGGLIFIKQRQYPGPDRERLSIDTKALLWSAGAVPGIEFKLLYAHADYPERMQLEYWQPGAVASRNSHPHSQEILVLKGSLEDEYSCYPAGTWLQIPAMSLQSLFSSAGCVLYVKTGGFDKMAYP